MRFLLFAVALVVYSALMAFFGFQGGLVYARNQVDAIERRHVSIERCLVVSERALGIMVGARDVQRRWEIRRDSLVRASRLRGTVVVAEDGG